MLLSTSALAAPDPAAIPRGEIDRTWGAITRASQYAGSWSVILDDGTRLAGDWAVADEAETANRWTTRRWLHLVSSKTADYCSIDVRESRMFCATAAAPTAPAIDLHLPEGTSERFALDTEIQQYDCSHGSCVAKRAGEMTRTLRPMRATLAQTQMLFARIHRTSLAGLLSAQLTARTTVQATAPSLVLDVRYATRGEERNARSVTRGQWEAHGFDREVIEYTAQVTIGPAPAQVVIAPRELGRHVEACERGGHHGSCSAPQETCTRRER